MDYWIIIEWKVFKDLMMSDDGTDYIYKKYILWFKNNIKNIGIDISI